MRNAVFSFLLVLSLSTARAGINLETDIRYDQLYLLQRLSFTCRSVSGPVNGEIRFKSPEMGERGLEFAGEIKANAWLAELPYQVKGPKNLEAKLTLKGNIREANKIYRSSRDVVKAREVLFDGQTQSLQISDSRLLIGFNRDQKASFKLTSSKNHLMRFEADDVDLDIEDVTPLSRNKDPQILVNTRGSCILEIQFQ